MSRNVRTRIAPSPTGPLHVGNLRTALFNYLFARRHSGAFILRLDDTDRRRSSPRWEDAIYENLEWVGLVWDEGPDRGGPHGPYRQSERGDLYRAAVQRLAERQLAYPCYCRPEEIEAERQASRAAGRPYHYSGRCRELSAAQRRRRDGEGEQAAWRYRVPHDEVISFIDGIRGEVRFPGKDVGDFVIQRSDGSALYNLASVVDDGAMSISHIIRGDEHLSNTPEQVLLYRGLDLPLPTFLHVGLVLNEARKKLSKRDDVVFVAELREGGYLPQALINFLALLGWSPGTEEEIFSLDELVERFNTGGLAAHGAVFDRKKLTSMNRRYLRDLPPEQLGAQALRFFVEAGLLQERPHGAAWDRYLRILDLLKSDADNLAQLADGAAPFYAPVTPLGPDLELHLTSQHARDVLAAFYRQLERLDRLEPGAVRTVIQTVSQRLGVKGRDLYMPLRVALTGAEHGPPLHETVTCLRRDQVLHRLRQALGIVRDPAH